jgi:signal transduction histidine kinase
LLHRALDNLLNNAIKYTANGGHIEVRAHKEGDSVFVEVEDNGRGIPADSHPRLFERFFRVATGEEDEPGTGLGLAIVKSVVDQHNGQVWMRSKVGEGSTFGLSLPIAK